MANGQQLAQEYFEVVKCWIAERDAMQDWAEHEHRGKVNRQVLADELMALRNAA